MEFIHDVLTFGHFLGMGLLMGGLVTHWRERIYRIGQVELWGVVVQLVTGLALFGTEISKVNHMKVTVKIALLLLIGIILWKNKSKLVSETLFKFTSGIVALIVGIAVFW